MKTTGDPAKWMAMAVACWFVCLVSFLILLSPRSILMLVVGSPILLVPLGLGSLAWIGSIFALVQRGVILKAAGREKALFFNTAMITMTLVVSLGNWILG